MPYGDFKDLTRRTASDKILCDLILLKIKNMMDIKEILFQWFNFFLVKKTSDSVIKMKICQTNNQQKNYTTGYQKKVKPPHIDNNWAADYADMQLIRKFNKGIHFL